MFLDLHLADFKDFHLSGSGFMLQLITGLQSLPPDLNRHPSGAHAAVDNWINYMILEKI